MNIFYDIDLSDLSYKYCFDLANESTDTYIVEISFECSLLRRKKCFPECMTEHFNHRTYFENKMIKSEAGSFKVQRALLLTENIVHHRIVPDVINKASSRGTKKFIQFYLEALFYILYLESLLYILYFIKFIS